MLEFEKDIDNRLELTYFSEDCTLNELINRLTNLNEQSELCQKCGKCCSDTIPITGFEIKRITEEVKSGKKDYSVIDLNFPDKPDTKEKEKSISEMASMFGFSKRHATVLYEYNTATPITMKKGADGQCVRISNNLCAQYGIRPLICRLYYCNTADRLAGLREIIISQGIWHSYYIMGWIDKREIEDNPFLNASNYDDVLLKKFDYRFDDINEGIDYLL
jgi:Fe-S-cluster containining protein